MSLSIPYKYHLDIELRFQPPTLHVITTISCIHMFLSKGVEENTSKMQWWQINSTSTYCHVM